MVEVLYELPLIGAAIVLWPSWAYISRKDEREWESVGGREGGKERCDVTAKSQSPLFSKMGKSF